MSEQFSGPSGATEREGPAAVPGRFTLPQFGIFAQGTHAHHILEFDLKSGVEPARAVAAFRQLRTPDVSAGGVNIVLAFGADAWRGVAPSMAPSDLGPFESIEGLDGRHAPAAQHDVWVWISGAEPDVTWQSARAATLAVADAADTRGGAGGVHVPRRTRHHRLHRRDGEPPGPPRRLTSRSWPRASRRRRKPRADHALGTRPRRVQPAPSRGSAARVRSHEGGQRGALRCREAAQRPHSTGRDDRGRRGARDLPAQRPLRDRRGARPVLRRVQRRALRASTACSRGCSVRAPTGCATASPTSPGRSPAPTTSPRR